MILIATEGAKTEPLYFSELKMGFRNVVTVIVSSGRQGQSNPTRVLKRLREAVKKQASWTQRDQAWLVVDTDKWTADERQSVVEKIASYPKFRLASSNPCFELWLVLHFQDGWPAATCGDLEGLLRQPRALGSYSKEAYDATTLMPLIEDAIARADRSNTTPDNQWPGPGQTHVHHVVRKIIQP